jgi:hypothetical protein
MPGYFTPGAGVTVRLLYPAGEAAAGGQGIQVLRAGHQLAHAQQLGVIASRVGIYPTGVSGASISASTVPEPTTRHIPGRTSSDRAFMAFAMAPGHFV